jgi:methionine aminopeptidase
MFLAPLAAAALVVSVATSPTADPRAFPTLSVHQKSAAMQSLMQSTTECIARSVSADPRLGQRNADLGDLIVDSMPHCAAQVRAMIEAYDRYFGESEGEGEAFFMGPYLDVLPSAVSKWVTDAVK